MSKSLVQKLYSLLYDLDKFGWHRQLYYLFRYAKSKKRLKFIIVYCHGRTGSTLFCESLGQSKEIIYEDEVLRRKLINPQNFVIGKAAPNPDKWFVIKVKPMHLQRMGISLKVFLGYFDKHQLCKIHLLRKNLFEHAISRILAKERGLYHKRKELKIPAPSPSTVSPDMLLNKMKELKGSHAEQKLEVKGMGFSELTYEENLDDSSKLTQAVLAIYQQIGIEEVPKLTDLKKVLDKDLSAEIKNWDEIKDLREFS